MSTRDKRFSKIGRDSRFIQLESRTSRKENVDGDARFANLGKSIADMAMETKSSKTHSTEEMQSDHSSDEHAEPIEEEYPLNSDDLEDEVIPYVDGEESTSLAIVNMDWDHIKLPICMSCSIPFCQRQESWSMSGCLCLSSTWEIGPGSSQRPGLDAYVDKEREKIFAEYRRNMDSGR